MFYYFVFVKGMVLLLLSIVGMLSGVILFFIFVCVFFFLCEECIMVIKVVGVVFGFFGVLLIV